jgi:hypothetical protein
LENFSRRLREGNPKSRNLYLENLYEAKGDHVKEKPYVEKKNSKWLRISHPCLEKFLKG